MVEISKEILRSVFHVMHCCWLHMIVSSKLCIAAPTNPCSFDPLGLKPTDPEELKVMQTKELNNGRLVSVH